MTRFNRAAAIVRASIGLSTVAAFGALGALGACATSSTVPAATASTGVSTVPLGTSDQWQATINSMMASGIRGTAAAVNGNTDTHATVSLGGLTPGNTYPWHIHVGQCGDNGPIFGPPASYPPVSGVTPDSLGTASATIPVALVTGTRYYVNIHKSPTEMGVIVACGDLMRSGS